MLSRILGKSNNQRGVTLIEILAVVIILGVLSAIAVPSVYGYIEKTRETTFLLEAVNLKAATIQAYESDPALRDGNIGGGARLRAATAIANNMHRSVESPVDNQYNVSGVAVPGATHTYITLKDKSVYLYGFQVNQATAERIAEALGLGPLPTPQAVHDDPSLKNPNIYWGNSSSLNTGYKNGKPTGILYILLYTYD